MRFLFLLFVALPILEMWLLIEVGSRIGALPTIALVVLTAFIGVNLLRQQGISTLTRAQTRLDAGEVPATEILEGLFLAVGGALLLTPGFVTDTLGFCCLVRPLRRRLIRRLLQSGAIRANAAFQQRAGARPEEADRRPNVTIEGEYRREDD